MYRAYSPTRLFLVALPLLALALLSPSTAFAGITCGNSSSELVYCTAPSGIESGGSPKNAEKTHHHTKPDTSPTTEEPTETTEPETEPHSGEGHKSHVAPPAKGGNRPGGGSPGSHATPKSQGDQKSPAKIVTPKTSGGQNSKGIEASASGGSSPVLPILVAIVVLATISIGIVVYRERKGGDGPAGYTSARG